MGILRSDRVSGLGGANAINGSAHFQGGDGNVGTAWNRYIDAGVSEDYNFGTGDFTVECWINRKVVTNDDTIWGTTLAEASTGFMWYFDSSGNMRAYVGGSQKSSTSNSISAGTWYHVAITRASGTMQMWVDGVSKYSATVSGTVGSSTQNFIIGEANLSYGSNAYHFLGHISNLRIQKGKAEYTAAFTPPTTKLEVTPETVLLACHDPGNVLAEATGKTLTLVRSAGLTMSAGIVASRFVPNVGEDHGTTFEDNTRFDTLSYMVPPGGKTTDRYLKSTGDIVSGNLIWHIDAGNTTSYAGVTTSGTTIYDLKAGSGMNGTVGIATLTSGHADFPVPGWTPDNGGAWYLGSDSTTASNYTGQLIIMPDHSLGNDNYTINAWVKLKYYSENSGNYSFIVSNKDGGPVSFHAHIKKVSGQGRIGAGAYYSSWSYDYASGADENTMIALNKWYMLTWVNTAQYTQSMYVNGVIQKLNGGAYTWNSRTSNNTPVNSVAGYGTNEETNAWIGQIQHYNDTLTAAEILQNYNVHKCRYDQ